ncbi:MAG: archaeosine synthase subunit alpha [Methanoregula sp.]|nr:archaeosine synthase subunit alpha [Methanoregula sp.]
MATVEVKKRDGLARTGILTLGEEIVRLPGVLDTEVLFPDLADLSFSNVPLTAPEPFVAAYLAPSEGQPVTVHPALAITASSGNCVMVANWNTALGNPRSYTEWLVRLKEHLPPDTSWYAPGAALPSNVHILCYSGFDLFDFIAVDLKTAQYRFCLAEGEFPAEIMETGVCGCEGCNEGDLKTHNRLALKREIALVTRFIADQQLREFVEARSRMVAVHVAILRHLDNYYSFLEQHLPVVRSGRLGAMSGEALKRPEVRRFAGRVLNRYIPPSADVAVLLPCSARKPYSASQSHRKFSDVIGGRALELIVTSPLGLVPRELERIYPAAHYDIPVTGYWDREELAFTAGIVADFLKKHPFRRVITHLEGGALEAARMAAAIAGITMEESCSIRPAAGDSLRNLGTLLDGERQVRQDPVHGTLSWQFGIDVDTRGMTVRWKPPNLSVKKGKEPLFSLDPGTGLLRPTFEGWKYIPEVYRVRIDDFVPQGDILAPGVIATDPAIREGDEVLVMGPSVVATGRAAMPASGMEASARGVAVRVRKIKKV